MRYLFLATLLFLQPLDAAFTLRGGKLVNSKDIATLPVQEHFQRGVEFLRERNWRDAKVEFRAIVFSYPDTSFAQEAEYYCGVCEYWLGEYEFANEHADRYLKSEANPPFFRQALEMKLNVAEAFRSGKRRRILGYSHLPKMVSGKHRALDIYDEVITAAGSSPIAVRALYGKAELLMERADYEGAVEAYKAITRRYPTHELAIESYAAMSRSYLTQVKKQLQNPELLSRAELNARKFEEAFPGEQKIEEVYQQLAEIREDYAKGLLETAHYYERKKKKNAALVYYRRAVERFPDTAVADFCREQLIASGEELPVASGPSLFGEKSQ